MSELPTCDRPGCRALAEWEIRAAGQADAHACTRHVGHLLADADEYRVLPVRVTVALRGET